MATVQTQPLKGALDQKEEVVDHQPPQCPGLLEAPQILEIVEEEEVRRGEEEGGMRDLTNEI